MQWQILPQLAQATLQSIKLLLLPFVQVGGKVRCFCPCWCYLPPLAQATLQSIKLLLTLFGASNISPIGVSTSSNYKTVVSARLSGGQSALLIHVPVKKHNWGAFINFQLQKLYFKGVLPWSKCLCCLLITKSLLHWSRGCKQPNDCIRL